MKAATRKTDETLLHWVAMRTQGISCASIGAGAQTSEAYVRAATNRVRSADIDESGEPLADAAYWGHR